MRSYVTSGRMCTIACHVREQVSLPRVTSVGRCIYRMSCPEVSVPISHRICETLHALTPCPRTCVCIACRVRGRVYYFHVVSASRCTFHRSFRCRTCSHSPSSLLLSSQQLSDTNVYEPSIRALLGIASRFCEVFSSRRWCTEGRRPNPGTYLQGYLAHKKLPPHPPRTTLGP